MARVSRNEKRVLFCLLCQLCASAPEEATYKRNSLWWPAESRYFDSMKTELPIEVGP